MSRANPRRFYIVWSPEGEAPPQVKHETFEAAKIASKSMANNHRGQTFFVLMACHGVCKPVDQPVEQVA